MRTRRRRLALGAPASLRWRLTAFVAAVMLGSAAVAFAVVYINTGSQLESQTDLDLRGDVTQLRQSLRSAELASPARAYEQAQRYVDAQPYSATSTLLFVQIPGLPLVSSQPGIVAIGHRHLGYSTHQVPGVGKLRFLAQALRVGGRAGVVGVAEPLAIVARAQRSIARAFVLAAGVTLLLALLASYYAGARVTAPLRRMAGIAARVDAGDLEPRMEDDVSRGEEVRVLADAFNHMLDRLTDAFETQRGFIADASHELRTPLTVIRGQLEVLAASDDPPADEVRRVEDVVQAEVTRMTRLVDDLMLLSAAEQDNFLRPEQIDLVQFVTDLWDGLELTAQRRFELGPVPAGLLNADPDRLATRSSRRPPRPVWCAWR
jgi:two-component system, OmpR family, sensor kinase